MEGKKSTSTAITGFLYGNRDFEGQKSTDANGNGVDDEEEIRGCAISGAGWGQNESSPTMHMIEDKGNEVHVQQH